MKKLDLKKEMYEAALRQVAEKQAKKGEETPALRQAPRDLSRRSAPDPAGKVTHGPAPAGREGWIRKVHTA